MQEERKAGEVNCQTSADKLSNVSGMQYDFVKEEGGFNDMVLLQAKKRKNRAHPE